MIELENQNQAGLFQKLIENPDQTRQVGIVHLEMVRESRSLYGMEKFDTPEKAAGMLFPLFERADREMVVVLSVNRKLEPLAVEIVAVGGLDACCMDVKNIFKHALLSNAGYVVCFHNHPSGDPEPSREDEFFTKRMQEAGRLLDIPLLDHIILGDGRIYSFRESSALKGWQQ